MSRKLKSELSNMIRSRIPLTDKEIAACDPTELYQMAYAALEGTREATGKNDGKVVEMIQYSVGLKKGDSWCMAAAQAALRFVELWTGKISSIAVGGHCLTVYKQSPANQIKPTEKPQQGDMIIYQHGSTSNGHVEGIIEIYKDAFAFTMGGNTSAGPGVERNGDGVYARMRTLRGPTGDMKIFGFLRPYPAATTTVKADA